MSGPVIAIVLPPLERFCPGDAGAVVLTVREFVLGSRWGKGVTVYGCEPEHFPDINYQQIRTPFSRFLGPDLAYALAVVSVLQDSAVSLVEVHSCISLALHLKGHLHGRKITLHLHDDPQGIHGSGKKVRERRRLLRELDAIYCSSQFVRERLLERIDDKGIDHVLVVRNAIQLAPPVDFGQKLLQLVYPCRVIPENGVLEVAEVMRTLLPEFPQWRVVFLGARGFGHEIWNSAYEHQVNASLKPVAGQVECIGAGFVEAPLSEKMEPP